MNTFKENLDLVGFQKKLNMNLDSASAADSIQALLGFKSADLNWLIDMSELKEVSSVPLSEQIQKVHLAKNWILGFSNFKGSVYTLMDLQFFLGYQQTSLSLASRCLLLADHHKLNIGLIASSILGLIDRSGLQVCSDEKTEYEKKRLPDFVDFIEQVFVDESGEHWFLVNVVKMTESRKINEIEK